MEAYHKTGKPANPNRTMSTRDVLESLRTQSPTAFAAARVVGRWVWCEFEDKPAVGVRAVLAELGFHWNRDRVAWQHPCGVFAPRSRRDPRGYYGEIPASELLESVGAA